MTIARFNLNNSKNQLEVFTDNTNTPWQLGFEFLRVIVMTEDGKQPLVTNQKDACITAIESVGKHGYRFIFKDSYQVIFNEEDLAYLAQHKDELWQQYLDAIKTNGLSREAMIDIKQL